MPEKGKKKQISSFSLYFFFGFSSCQIKKVDLRIMVHGATCARAHWVELVSVNLLILQKFSFFIQLVCSACVPFGSRKIISFQREMVIEVVINASADLIVFCSIWTFRKHGDCPEPSLRGYGLVSRINCHAYHCHMGKLCRCGKMRY